MNRHRLGVFSLAALAATLLSCGTDDYFTADDPARGDKPGSGARDGLYRLSVSAGRGDNGEDPATRAQMNAGGDYYWTLNDRVGLVVTRANSSLPLPSLENLMLENDGLLGNATPFTTFSSPLDDNQVADLSEGGLYDYYSYFPYDAGTVDAPALTLRYPMQPTYTLGLDEFVPEYAPMVAVPTTAPGAVYLRDHRPDEFALPQLHYRHVLSYIAIDMDVALLQEPVTSIRIVNTAQDHPIAGTLEISLQDGSYTLTEGNNEIIILLKVPLVPGSGHRIYVPILPGDYSADEFTIRFSPDEQVNRYTDRRVQGMVFERGRIHTLKIAPPATYTTNENFEITKTGWYQVEAWGGDGGSTIRLDKIGYGGSGGEVRSVFYLEEGDRIDVIVGLRGEDASSQAYFGTGGDSSIGAGANGGRGGAGRVGILESGDSALRAGYAGAGGGGASGIKAGNAVWLCAGGGGGAGGFPGPGGGTLPNSYNNWSTLPASDGNPASNTDQSQIPGGWTDAIDGEAANGTNGGLAGNGEGGDPLYNYGGGGGGGGGGGYPLGGYGGAGRNNGNINFGSRTIGYAGGGGMNHIHTAPNPIGTAPPPPQNLPVHTYPASRNGQGYVVISFIRTE